MYRICLALVILLSVCVRPQSQNITFDILGGEDRVEVPFKFIHNFIIVEIRLFGMLPMNFIFDTGAENTILLTRQFADFIGTDYDLRIPILGSDMSQRVYALVARSVEVELVGLPPQRRDILVLEENHFNLTEITGVQIHGLLGGSFFKNSVLEVDYKKQRLIFHNPQQFKPPGSGFNQIPVEIDHNKPYVQAGLRLQAGTSIDLRLLLDTGAGLPLLLHNNSHPSLTLPDNYILGLLGVGLGGFIEGYVGRTDQLELAGIEFNQVLTSFQDIQTTVDNQVIWSRNGLIGNQLLHRTRMIIDYVREIAYFKARRGHSRRFRMDRSGLIVVATGVNLDGFIVRGTIPGSPAEAAGLLPGDKILRLQGLPAHGFKLDQLTRILQKKEGKRIRIVIERDGQRKKIEFRLRELV